MSRQYFAQSPPATVKLYSTCRLTQLQSSLNISEWRHRSDTWQWLSPQRLWAVIIIHFNFPTYVAAVHYSGASLVIFALSFSFHRNVNIYTEPISPGGFLPFTQRHSFRKLLMLYHKGRVPLISMYISWISPRQPPNSNFIGLLSMSMRAWARAQSKLKLSVSAQSEKRNRHNDIQHSDWNDRCWEEATHHVITCTLLFHIYSPKIYVKRILNINTRATADSMALDLPVENLQMPAEWHFTCDV